jgi:hypothetical protein
MSDSYRAVTPWSPARPETLVVCCSDGRWHAQMTEFVHAEVSDRADLYCVPGGPAVLDPWNSTFDEARVFEQSMRLFAEHHAISGIWLIAHQGCAWYKLKHSYLDAPAIVKRQVSDMRRGKQILLERHPTYDVRLILAELDGQEVVFRDCTRSPEEVQA